MLSEAASRFRGDASVVLLTFVVLGLPLGTLGVAWPAMRGDLDAPLAGLGFLLSALTLAEAGSSVLSGTVLPRLGPRRLLVGSALGAALSLAVIGLAPTWEVTVLGGLLLGAAVGFLDVAVNAYGALTRGIRYLGALHGSWAVGAALGPPAIGLAILAGGSWRLGFLLLSLFFMLAAIGLARTALPAVPVARDVGRVPRRAPIVVLGGLMFFLYIGIEIGAGSWSFVRLTDGGVGAVAAGIAVTLYWAMLAAARIALAAWGDRLRPDTLLDLSIGGTVIAGIGVWLLPIGVGGFVALPVLGAALGMIIPLLVFLTPARVGRASASSVIGLQFAAAMLGGATIPVAIGYLMELGGSATLGPAVALLSLALTVAHLAARGVGRSAVELAQ